MVDQSAESERVGNPRGRHQHCAAQCPPRDTAARPRERDDSDEGDRLDNVLEGLVSSAKPNRVSVGAIRTA